jgi:hypothetical protein
MTTKDNWIERIDEEIRQSNEILRSAYAIAMRNGKDTDWDGFRKKLDIRLDVQHKIMYPKTDSKKEEVKAVCSVCGEPMPEGEEMFKIHGYSGDCPTTQRVYFLGTEEKEDADEAVARSFGMSKDEYNPTIET